MSASVMMRPSQSSRTKNSAWTALENDILKALLYFDGFQYPLKVSEIHKYLRSNTFTPTDVWEALQSPSLGAKIATKDGYYSVASAPGSCIDERLEKERRAARLMRVARVMGKIIRMFPFVRGVFISGELSKGIASKRSDIDFVVVTQEGRLWIARTLLILFKKGFLLNRKRFFCLNHFVTEHHLQVELQNIYTATEVATLLPLENDLMFSRYMFANLWISHFFPNCKVDERLLRSGRNGTSVVQIMLEHFVPQGIAPRLDRWLMLRWRWIWQTRYAHLSEEERNRKYQCSEYLSTAYGEDYQERILRSFGTRLREFEVF